MNALKLIQIIKDKYAGVTYADLFQLASATAIEVLVTLQPIGDDHSKNTHTDVTDLILSFFRKLVALKSP